MFLGEYQHSLDAKGRVILPVEVPRPTVGRRLRDQGEGRLPLRLHGAGVQRGGQTGAREASKRGRARARRGPLVLRRHRPRSRPDKQGRIAIPQHLREYAGLDADVVVAGVFSRIEIWDGRRWRERDREGEQSLNESDELPDFGI